MNIFVIYLLGCCLTGFIFSVCMYSNAFIVYLNNMINKAKSEIKNQNKYSLQEITLLDNIDNNYLINSYKIISILLSWIGLILVIIDILQCIFKK